eukprot:s4273_g5.t1
MAAAPSQLGGLPADAHNLALEFLDVFTLVRCTSLSRAFIPAKIQDHYLQHLMNLLEDEAAIRRIQEQGMAAPDNEGTLRCANQRQFVQIARSLWKKVARPLRKMVGPELTCPGMHNNALVAIHVLGRQGVHDVTPKGARELAGLQSSLEPAPLWEHLPADEENILAILRQDNRHDADVCCALTLLQQGSWHYDLYPAHWDPEEDNDTTAILHFDVFGLQGALLLTEIYVEPAGSVPDRALTESQEE